MRWQSRVNSQGLRDRYHETGSKVPGSKKLGGFVSAETLLPPAADWHGSSALSWGRRDETSRAHSWQPNQYTGVTARPPNLSLHVMKSSSHGTKVVFTQGQVNSMKAQLTQPKPTHNESSRSWSQMSTQSRGAPEMCPSGSWRERPRQSTQVKEVTRGETTYRGTRIASNSAGRKKGAHSNVQTFW